MTPHLPSGDKIFAKWRKQFDFYCTRADGRALIHHFPKYYLKIEIIQPVYFSIENIPIFLKNMPKVPHCRPPWASPSDRATTRTAPSTTANSSPPSGRRPPGIHSVCRFVGRSWMFWNPGIYWAQEIKFNKYITFLDLKIRFSWGWVWEGVGFWTDAPPPDLSTSSPSHQDVGWLRGHSMVRGGGGSEKANGEISPPPSGMNIVFVE